MHVNTDINRYILIYYHRNYCKDTWCYFIEQKLVVVQNRQKIE